MRTIQLNNSTITDTDLQFMELHEINSIMCELQEKSHKLAAEKRRLTTLPKNKKNGKTISEVTGLSEQLMKIQDDINYVSMLKKNKRDVMQKERDFYQKFAEIAKRTLKKNVFQSILGEATQELGYASIIK